MQRSLHSKRTRKSIGLLSAKRYISRSTDVNLDVRAKLDSSIHDHTWLTNCIHLLLMQMKSKVR